MDFKLRIQHELDLPSDQDIRSFDLGRAVHASAKFAHQKMGELWHRKFLPQHFGPNAGARYGYQQRTPGYMQRKVPGKSTWRNRMAVRSGSGMFNFSMFKQTWRDTIEGGPNDFNVYTGALRRIMSKNPSFRAYPTRVTIDMPTLPYIYKAHASKQGKQPDKTKEIAGSFTEQEMQELAKEFHWQFWWDFLGKLKRKRLTITGTGAVSIALRN